MSIAATLAAGLRRPLEPAAADHLRTLTACNLAAAAGELGRAGELIAAIPLAAERSAPEAAYLNAMALHARTQDDFYPAGRVHVGAVSLAVALALGEQVGERLLPALAAGYEVLCRVSAAYSASAQASGLRPIAVFGPLGAAATAAVALDLDEDRAADALAFAATLSGGTNAAWRAGTDEWVFEIGAAARLGVEAALFARAGVHGSPLAIEGRAGWAEAFFGDPGAGALAALLEDDRSRIGGVAIKPYPVSGIAQVPTELGARAHREHADAGPAPMTIRVSEREAAYPGSTNRSPFNSRSDALMSIAFCVAASRRDGVVRLARLEHPNEDGMDEAAAAVQLRTDPDLGETEAVLELPDGTELAGQGSDLLYPSWAETLADLEAVATRSEAPLATVVALAEELARERPSAAALGIPLPEPAR